jgi:H+/Cl- antiporter ClcA
MSHLFIAAYVFVTIFYLFYAGSLMTEEPGAHDSVPFVCLCAYLMCIIAAVVGMFVVYFAEDLFRSGPPHLSVREFLIGSIVVVFSLVAWALVRAYSNFINKHL